MGAIKTLADAAWVDGSPVNKASVRGVTDQIDTEVESAKTRLTTAEADIAAAEGRLDVLEGAAAPDAISEATADQIEAAVEDTVYASPRRLRALYDLMPDRPGEFTARYTSDITGTLLNSSALSTAMAITDSEGRVVRITGAGIVAPASPFRIEPGHEYRVRFVIRRRVNSPDPANDSVRCAIRWLTSTKAGVGTSGTQVIQDFNSLTTGDGRQVVSAVVSMSSGSGIDYTAPAGTIYARPYVEQFGSSATATDVEVIQWTDLTDIALFAPDLTALTSRVDALESIDAGNRLDAVEALVAGSEIARYKTRAAALAATIGASIDVIETLGYANEGDGGAAMYIRAASEPSHPGKFQSVDGAWWELRATVIRPGMFGAFGSDGGSPAADDTAGLNDALDYLRAVQATAGDLFTVNLDGGDKLYRVDGSINATLIRGHGWGIRNIRVDAHCSGKVVLDLTGSRFGRFADIDIWGDATDTPYTGIQQARTGAGQASGTHKFSKVVVKGHYLNAALHNYCSEVCKYEASSFWNARAKDGSGESWGAIFDGAGKKTIISDFVSPLPTGNHAFNLTRCDSTEFRAEGGSPTGSAVYITGAFRITFDDCYFVSTDEAPITIECTGAERHVTLRGLFEGGVAHFASIINFIGDVDAVRLFYGLTLETHRSNATDQVFQITDLARVTLYYPVVKIVQWGNTPSVGVFDDASKYRLVDYDFVLPTLAAMNDRAAFNGSTLTSGRILAINADAPEIRMPSYTVATLPSAAPPAQLVMVRDRDYRTASSDGTNWRFADGTVVS